MKLEPDNADQTQSLALLYHRKNQPERALELLNKLIARYPTKADFYVSRASLMVNKADWNAAKADFDKAISVEPKNYEVYNARSMYFMNTSSPELAKNDLEQAIILLGEDIANNFQNAPLILKRAEFMEQIGNIQGALNEYENYLKTWPLNLSVLKNIAQEYCSLKQWQKAIDSYTTIIDNFPESTKIFFDRSRVYEQTGNLQKALDDLNNLIRIYPKEYSYFYFRAKIKNQLHDPDYKKDIKTTAVLLNELKTKRNLSQEEQNLLSSILK